MTKIKIKDKKKAMLNLYKFIILVGIIFCLLILIGSISINKNQDQNKVVVVQPSQIPILTIPPTSTPEIMTVLNDKNIVQTVETKPLTSRELFTKFFPDQDYDKTVDVLSKVLRKEAGVVKSKTNRACVIWCILNRVDKKMRGDTIIKCATSDHQFCYRKRTTYSETISNIVKDVLYRWLREKNGEINVGRVLPPQYTFFYGNGKYNVFRNQYKFRGCKSIKPIHSDVYGD